MSVSVAFGQTAQGEGIYGASSVVETAEMKLTAKPDIPAALTSTLTTRGSNTTGTITLATGHGLTTAQVVDLYWTVAGVNYSAHGAVLGTTTSTTAPIASVAGGDNLPVADTVIYVGVRVSTTLNWAGNDTKAIVMTAGVARGYITISDGTYVRLAPLVVPGTMYSWNYSSGITNPLATFTLTTVYFSHGDPDRTITDLTLNILKTD